MDMAAFTAPDLEESQVQLPPPALPTPKKVVKPLRSGLKKAVKPSKPSVERVKSQMPGPEEDDTGCLVHGVAETLRLGQSYRSIGFNKERAITNQALAARRE